MSFLAYLLPVTYGLLQLVLIFFLLRGPFRRYPLLLLYCVFQISVVVLSGWVFSAFGAGSPLYRNLYWATDVVVDLVLFLMVITITREVMKENPRCPGVGSMLEIILCAAVARPVRRCH